MCLSVRERLNLLVVALGALVLVRATLPGLLGTITGFFLGAAEDDSVTARLDDYPVVDKFFAESPWIGRGLGTFLPEEYVLLDNQYLMSLVEGGIVLLGATIAFFVLALASAGEAPCAPRLSPTPRGRRRSSRRSRPSRSPGCCSTSSASPRSRWCCSSSSGSRGMLWHHGQQNGLAIPDPVQRFRNARSEHRPAAKVATPKGRQVGVGGAFSVDRDRRREGMTLWADLEEPTQEDIEQLGDDPLDVLLTHEHQPRPAPEPAQTP
ncbi:O-antigen ligase family protein [Georgenia sp. SUBG003]|uniref:O-antigen ligase family protein n=1 Tax=Georgenia sp. SUBG003 TaxID=1497974 RepID=UPI003AB11212